MLKLAALLGLLTVASSTPVDLIKGPAPDGERRVPLLDGRIVGGSAVNITDYPWQLSVRRSGIHVCGASIISSAWAMTAAHCVEGSTVNSLTLLAGSSYYESGGTVYTLRAGYLHASYSSATLDYDIAVLQPANLIDIGSPGIRSIHPASDTPAEGTILYVSGWGITSDGEDTLQSQLRAVEVPYVSRETCSSAYDEGAITFRMICAGYTSGGKDACQGDSGGPLVDPETLLQYGIVSWGYGCGVAGYPGVYTSVPFMRAWITFATGV